MSECAIATQATGYQPAAQLLPIHIRAADSGDDALIIDHWAKRLRKCHGWRDIPLSVADHAARAHIRQLLSAEPTFAWVAYPDIPGAGPSDVCGFLIGRKGVLYWVHTRLDWRRQHIATRLVDFAFSGQPLQAIHHTPHLHANMRRWRVTHNPRALYDDHSDQSRAPIRQHRRTAAASQPAHQGRP